MLHIWKAASGWGQDRTQKVRQGQTNPDAVLHHLSNLLESCEVVGCHWAELQHLVPSLQALKQTVHPVMYWHGSCQRASSDVLTWSVSTCIHQHTEMEHVNTPSDVLAWIMSTHMWHTDTDDVNAHPVTYWDGTCQHTPSDVLTRMMSTFIQRSYVLARIISTCIPVSYTHLTLPTSSTV